MYGREVLTEIVEAMSNPDKQVLFIMAGYEKDMKRLFDANRGLERRFGALYRFKKPSGLFLEKIFRKQLKDSKWKFQARVKQEIRSFFELNQSKLPYAGGSTQQLLFHVKQASILRTFPNATQKTITIEDLHTGLKSLTLHNSLLKPAAIPTNMYL